MSERHVLLRSPAASLGRRFRVVLVALMVAGVSFGCESESPEVQTDAADTVGTTGFLAAPECTGCLETACTGALRTCDADPACSALQRCRSSCEDAACDEACVAEHGSPEGGEGAYAEALATCAEGRCARECPGRPTTPARAAECSNVVDAQLATVVDRCGDALACACTACAETWIACLESPDCVSVALCAFECPVPNCVIRSCPYDSAFVEAYRCIENRCEPCAAAP